LFCDLRPAGVYRLQQIYIGYIGYIGNIYIYISEV